MFLKLLLDVPFIFNSSVRRGLNFECIHELHNVHTKFGNHIYVRPM